MERARLVSLGLRREAFGVQEGLYVFLCLEALDLTFNLALQVLARDFHSFCHWIYKSCETQDPVEGGNARLTGGAASRAPPNLS